MTENPNTAKIQLSWTRRQWLKVGALVGDYPKIATFCFTVLAGLVLFYAFRLGGISHFLESGGRWRLETFGGSHHVGRAVQTPDVILSMKHPKYNRLDALAPTAAHFGGTAFYRELKELIEERDGLLRVIALDPRLAEVVHPNHDRFAALAEVFGMSTRELGARCWYSTAVLLYLEQEFGDGIEIRLISTPNESAEVPYFCLGRSGHYYFLKDKRKRLDVIVPRPDEPTFSDSFTQPGVIYKNRPNNPEVVRFTKAFKSTWESSLPLDQALQEEFRKHLDGQSNPGS